MKNRIFALALAVAIPAIPLAAQAVIAPEPPPLSAYGELPGIEDAALSPDGSRIAVLTTVRGERMLFLLQSDMKALTSFTVGDAKVRDIVWAGNDRILLRTSNTQNLHGFNVDKAEFSYVTVVPVDPAEKVRTIFDGRGKLVNATFGSYGLRQIGGRWYGYYGAMVMRRGLGGVFEFDHGRPYLYRVELGTNSPELVDSAGGEDGYRDWLVARDGTVAARLDVSLIDGDWAITSGGRRIASGKTAGAEVGLVCLGKDGTTVIYSIREGEGDRMWFEMSLAGGEAKPFLADVDVERIYVDRYGGNLLGYLKGGGEPRPHMYDPALDAKIRKIRAAFSKYEMGLMEFTPDLDTAIVRTSGNLDSGSWFIVDVANLKAQAIGYERVAVQPELVGPISVVDYTASDGTELDGILTLPPGRDAQNLPLVMLPHGGPSGEDRAEFDWWAQAFASRGYAVFQPNFRGSTNRDDAFRRAGYGEWGGKMQTDLSDGLAALAERGIIDPRRSCIVGASYGGYAALAGVTLQSGLYRCAVSVAGVSDLDDVYQEDYRQQGETRMSKVRLLEQLGPKNRWKAVSPRRQAENADAPVLLIHGKDDTVVPYSHTLKMADALKDAGKPYEVVTLDGEDHWLSRAATRQQMLEAAVAFVKKHNPPG